MITDNEGTTMWTQGESSTYDGIMQGNERLSANLVGTNDRNTKADLIEIRLSKNGTTSTMRLTKTETDVFSLLLARLAADGGEIDDLDAGNEDSTIVQRPTEDRRSITRDAFIQMLLDLPRKSEIEVPFGGEHVASANVAPWEGKSPATLRCYRLNLLELLNLRFRSAEIDQH